MTAPRFFDFIPYGGDYNPDQWPQESWAEDMKLLKQARVNFLTLPVFSWAKLQPSESVYEFGWLDEILDQVADNGIKVCFATPTAAQPAWMSRQYPDVLPVDVQGRKRVHGKRVNFCPNSATYRRFAAAIAQKMASRYKDHPALAMWHVANEYGTMCYCETCATAFRGWLDNRYGSVERLNERWNLAFWGHTVYSWDDVTVPSQLNDDDTCSPSKSLDYLRFMTDSTIGCFLNECEVIREVSPAVPVTTNISGFIKKLDQSRIAAHVDVVGWDNYPSPDDDPSTIALKHDIMRGLKNGAPFFMVEQSPNQQNWQPYNVLKRPGEVRRLSYQALGRGSDAVLFFQMKANRGGVEKLHGAFISHAGRADTRTYREMATLGAELEKLGGRFTGATTPARVAMLFDWDNWWAIELSSGPSRDLRYFEQINKYYAALYRRNIAVDLVRPTAELSGYDLVVAPVLYMLTNEVADNVETFVSAGGTLLTTFFSGVVDENDLVTVEGMPGRLRPIAGVWAEEIDALPPGKSNTILLASPLASAGSGDESSYSCGQLCEIIHSEGAQVMATYGEDFYAGSPCLTRNSHGKGLAYYVATDGDERFVQDLLDHICAEKGVNGVLTSSAGVEVSLRCREGTDYIFITNHTEHDGTVTLPDGNYTNLLTGRPEAGSVTVGAGDVCVLELPAMPAKEGR
jgi:beta-galactosidase